MIGAGVGAGAAGVQGIRANLRTVTCINDNDHFTSRINSINSDI